MDPEKMRRAATEAKALADKAPEGPWTFDPADGRPGHGYCAQVWSRDGDSILTADEIGDAGTAAVELATHARTSVPLLADHVLALAAEVERLEREAIETKALIRAMHSESKNLEARAEEEHAETENLRREIEVLRMAAQTAERAVEAWRTTAEVATAVEREACANVCDERGSWGAAPWDTVNDGARGARECAARIRARGTR